VTALLQAISVSIDVMPPRSVAIALHAVRTSTSSALAETFSLAVASSMASSRTSPKLEVAVALSKLTEQAPGTVGVPPSHPARHRAPAIEASAIARRDTQTFIGRPP